MCHLLERFFRGRITGERHLQMLALWEEEKLRKHLESPESGLAQTPLEVEALVQGLIRKKPAVMFDAVSTTDL